jgi:hypothetical protein
LERGIFCFEARHELRTGQGLPNVRAEQDQDASISFDKVAAIAMHAERDGRSGLI